MRERRGVDLVPLAGTGGSGDRQPRHGDNETENDAPEHDAGLRKQHNQSDTIAK
jgi:hypothetical protein